MISSFHIPVYIPVLKSHSKRDQQLAVLRATLFEFFLNAPNDVLPVVQTPVDGVLEAASCVSNDVQTSAAGYSREQIITALRISGALNDPDQEGKLTVTKRLGGKLERVFIITR